MNGNKRDWIEEVFRKQRPMLLQNLYNTVQDYDIAGDALQEAFLMALLTPDGYIESYNHAGALVNIMAKRIAINMLKKKVYVTKKRTDIEEVLYDETTCSIKGGIFDYHPIAENVMKSLREMDHINQIAVIAYMYDIPLTILAKAYKGERNGKHPNLVNKLNTSLKQIKRSVFPEERIQHILNKQHKYNDPDLDKMYTMRLAKMTYRQIAEHFGSTVNKIKLKLRNRIINMKKYPELYKNIEMIVLGNKN